MIRGKTGVSSGLEVNRKSRHVRKKLEYAAKKWTGTDETSKDCLIVRKDSAGNILSVETIQDTGKPKKPRKTAKKTQKKRRSAKKKKIYCKKILIMVEF